MAWMDETGSISPLPAEGRTSQKVMAVFGLLSTIATTLLWLHMAYRLMAWKLEDAGWIRKAVAPSSSSPREEEVDLSLGLPENAYRRAKSVPQDRARSRAASLGTNGDLSSSTTHYNGPNPLLLLIHNLILADVFLSACYLENIVWLRKNAILVGSSYCHAQGMLVSFGCLSSSMFLASMALYTYLTITHGYKPKGRFVLINILLVWVLSLILTFIPMLGSRGTDLWGRNNLWCWINRHYYLWRLTVYIPGFGALGAACFLHTLTFWGLFKDKRSARFMPPALKRSNTETSRSFAERQQSTRLRPSGHHPAFLVYPVIFTICSAPVTLGSVFAVTENSTTFMAISGPIMALTGLLDTIVWSSTILFSDEKTIKQTGLDRFTVTSESQRRALGNLVWVQGGQRDAGGSQSQKPNRKGRDWWPIRSDLESDSREQIRPAGNVNQGVHIETETSVIVEGGAWKSWDDGGLQPPYLETLPLRDLSKASTAKETRFVGD
ncbi:hypothetical protein N0V93_004406 [Gnomoniopsis smithogilvyi]|uniref:G-protein coupled receptors family 1 profile domain-containing protein n=1 Tax=Gnomoniopsis smithogilvyi TaxID=1191159 RepID=A0A9W8YSC0_9PEZI|nr:hypothetical protein N0V93_004406 [Gnomoniopsis smithogilvyi]